MDRFMGSAIGVGLTLAALLPVWAQQPPSSELNAVVRIVERGADGDAVYYVARCRDGSSASLALDHVKDELCAQPKGAAKRCRRDWSLAEAAAFACRRDSR